VRVILNERGVASSAEAPAKENGRLEIRNVLLGRIETGIEAESITKQQFVELCGRAASRSQGLKPGDGPVNPEGKRELSVDEIVKKIPADLYDGITGDAEAVAQARIDREQGLLASLRLAATDAESKGDFDTAESLDRDAIDFGRVFYGRSREG
jgi:hypothetical protein